MAKLSCSGVVIYLLILREICVYRKSDNNKRHLLLVGIFPAFLDRTQYFIRSGFNNDPRQAAGQQQLLRMLTLQL